MGRLWIETLRGNVNVSRFCREGVFSVQRADIRKNVLSVGLRPLGKKGMSKGYGVYRTSEQVALYAVQPHVFYQTVFIRVFHAFQANLDV